MRPLSITLTVIFADSPVVESDEDKPGTIKVLIAFGRQAGPAEQALVRGMGGSVKYSY